MNRNQLEDNCPLEFEGIFTLGQKLDTHELPHLALVAFL